MRRCENTSLSTVTVCVPGSKSYTQRALICAALAEGSSEIRNALDAEDITHFIDALRALGARIKKEEDALIVEGNGGRLAHPEAAINLGNNGTALRFFTTLVALGKGRYELTGSKRLLERPVGPLVRALKDLGVKASCEGEHPPVIIEAGGLSGGRVTLSDIESSQYVSSLLLAAPFAKSDMIISLEGKIASRPYLDMTVEVMKRFGATVKTQKGNRYCVEAGRRYRAGDYVVEGDASSASYFMLAAALLKRAIRILNVNPRSLQGDIKFIDVMEQLGCTVTRGDDWIEITGRELPEGVCIFSMGDMPDMVPTLAVLSAFRNGQTVIKDAAHLRIKESDRLAALVNELRKTGITAVETSDGMVIQGGSPREARIETYKDHRMAMSFAVAALAAPGMRIDDPDCVGKSFPGFWDELKKL